MKPDLPTNCREHASGRVMESERHLENGEVQWETVKFLCGCYATLTLYHHSFDEPPRWQLDETIFWKEGQA